MSWCSDAPEDEATSLFAGLLANPDMRLSLKLYPCLRYLTRLRDEKFPKSMGEYVTER
jgi:hypothetical protein